jgi:hypothetical protein
MKNYYCLYCMTDVCLTSVLLLAANENKGTDPSIQQDGSVARNHIQEFFHRILPGAHFLDAAQILWI